MAREPVGRSQSGDVEESGRGRTSRPVRAFGLLVVLGFAAAFVVQNSQKVAVHLWFVTGHVRLLWLAVVCFVLGAAGEMVVRRAVRIRWRGRRQRSR